MYTYLPRTHKFLNMILEIKPYHGDIIMKQMWIVYKNKHTD